MSAGEATSTSSTASSQIRFGAPSQPSIVRLTRMYVSSRRSLGRWRGLLRQTWPRGLYWRRTHSWPWEPARQSTVRNTKVCRPSVQTSSLLRGSGLWWTLHMLLHTRATRGTSSRTPLLNWQPRIACPGRRFQWCGFSRLAEHMTGSGSNTRRNRSNKPIRRDKARLQSSVPKHLATARCPWRR